jgi:hypothetical protein
MDNVEFPKCWMKFSDNLLKIDSYAKSDVIMDVVTSVFCRLFSADERRSESE